jgi:hypothetical protein
MPIFANSEVLTPSSSLPGRFAARFVRNEAGDIETKMPLDALSSAVSRPRRRLPAYRLHKS